MPSPDSKVAIAYVHPNQGVVHERFANSLGRVCANMGQQIISVSGFTAPWQTVARNLAIGASERMDPAPDYLLWWDTDMEPPATALRDLLEAMELYDAKMGTIFGVMLRQIHMEGQDWTPVPNAFWWNPDWVEKGDRYYIRNILPSYTEPFWCDATGLGFTLIHMDMFRAWGEEDKPYHLLEEGELGHDVRFFDVTRRLTGERVLYVPTVRAAHHKNMPMTFDLYLNAFGITEEEAIELAKEPPSKHF